MTKEQLKISLNKATDANIDVYYPILTGMMEKYNITEIADIAAFMATIGHESSHLSRLQENLTYSAGRLREIFPKYFPSLELANAYARQPEKIANRAYASRMGNGNEASGDGWRYRGRGLMQITGRANYAACGKALGLDLIGNPDLLLQPQYAVESACWFFKL